MNALLSIPLASLALAFAICLGVSALGFRRVDYFISIGYGFSIAAQAVVFPLLYREGLDPWMLAADAMLFLYGMRLSLFLIARERHPSFERERIASLERSAHITGPLKLTIWVTVSALYVAMYAPVHLTLANAATVSDRLLVVLGVLVMIVGLVIETLADAQKSAFKAKYPARFCDAGLFRLVRSPNYFGEMVFWLGAFIAGLAHFLRPLDWMLALVGLVCIQLIMLGSARRLELKQAERYGADAAYQHYARTVPVLLPLLPLYSLRKLRVYLG